jgi:hypothetical protein
MIGVVLQDGNATAAESLQVPSHKGALFSAWLSLTLYLSLPGHFCCPPLVWGGHTGSDRQCLDSQLQHWIPTDIAVFRVPRSIEQHTVFTPAVIIRHRILPLHIAAPRHVGLKPFEVAIEHL